MNTILTLKQVPIEETEKTCHKTEKLFQKVEESEVDEAE